MTAENAVRSAPAHEVNDPDAGTMARNVPRLLAATFGFSACGSLGYEACVWSGNPAGGLDGSVIATMLTPAAVFSTAAHRSRGPQCRSVDR